MPKSAIEIDNDVHVPKKSHQDETPSDEKFLEDALNLIAHDPAIPPYTAIKIVMDRSISEISRDDFDNMRRRIKNRMSAIQRIKK